MSIWGTIRNVLIWEPRTLYVKRTLRPMTDAESKAFDEAFEHMDRAFEALCKVGDTR